MITNRVSNRILSIYSLLVSNFFIFCHALVILGSFMLVIGGAMKLLAPSPIILTNSHWLNASVAQMLGLIELLIGGWLYFFKHRQSPLVVAAATFVCFTIVLLLKSAYGIRFCNCMPAVNVSVTAMILIDSLILTGLVGSIIKPSSILKTRTFVDGINAGAIYAVTLVAMLLFGLNVTPHQAIQYVKGGGLILVRDEIVFVAAKRGDVVIDLMGYNSNSQTISLLGASSSCGCSAIEGLPIEIAPHTSSRFPIRISDAGNGGVFDYRAKLFVSDGRQIPVKITVLRPPVE